MLLLKPAIQERDEEDKREEAEGRCSTEAFCLAGADAGAAADSPDAPAAPRRPFLRGQRRCRQELSSPPSGSRFPLIYFRCCSVWGSSSCRLGLEVAGLWGLSEV